MDSAKLTNVRSTILSEENKRTELQTDCKGSEKSVSMMKIVWIHCLNYGEKRNPK